MDADTRLKTEEKIIAMLKTVYDPEIPVNIYDLGLIYKIDLQDDGEVVLDMFKKGKYSATQRRYLRDVMFTSWFERGKKLDKNDIFDMLCVGCLDHIDKTKNACVLIDASSYVLSFDTRMKNFIGTVKPENSL